MRISAITLLLFSLISTGGYSPTDAQTRRVKLINSLYVSETAGGTLVTVLADQPLTYVTRRNEWGFQLIIPGATAAAADSVIESRVFKGRFVKVQAERGGDGLVFRFDLLNQSNFKIKNNASGAAQAGFKIEVLASPGETKELRPSTNPAALNASAQLTDNYRKTISPAPVFTPVLNGRVANATDSHPVEVKKTNVETKNFSNAASDIPPVALSTLQIKRVYGAPSLKNHINKKNGLAGTEVTDFRQLSPDDGKPVSQPTKAYVSYDDANLYVVFVCAADPKQVRARMAKREDIWEDDQVSVVLDTFHDKRRAYVFSVNPLGVQLDSITTEGQGDDSSFDTLWYSDGHLTPDGYVALIQIPFKSLRFPDAEVQSWGIALRRTIAHKNEEAYYPYITQRKQRFLPQIATLEGLKQISPGRNIQLIPYYVTSAERSLAVTPDNNPYFRAFTDVRVGMDAKIVLKNAFTLDLTINPDFSQVESDEPQVTVNQRYETFFPEKRPFFIENAAFFNTPENLFFSRRIVDPQFGARLTGKTGKWALGALLIDDKAPGRLFPTDSFEQGKRAAAGAFRLTRELGDQSSVGVLLTHYNFASASNSVFSLDNRIKLNENWSFAGQFIRSYTTRRGGQNGAETGESYLASLSRSGRKFSYDLSYYDRSPNFKAELGFIPRVDIRQIEQSASYRWRPNKKGVNSFGPSAFASANWDRRGTLQDWYLWAGFGIDFTNLTGINLGRSKAYELYLGRGFYTGNTSVSFYTDRLSWLGINGSYSRGSSINYSAPVNLNPFKADSSSGSFGVTFRPGSQFSLRQTYIFSRLKTRPGEPFSGPAKASNIFTNHIFRSKLNYQFNRQLSLRAILDYNAVLPNAELIDLELSKRFTGDVLLTYMINPGTAIHVGYTDTYENLLLNYGPPAVLVRTRSPFNPSGRRFFIKVNNLIRF